MCFIRNFFIILHPLFCNGMPEIQGEMQEWLNWHAWKACVPGTVPGVRIPLSPQKQINKEQPCKYYYFEN